MKVAFFAVAAISAWLCASHQFPKIMHQVRLLMLLLGIGWPDS
jgi:hypothetical protein